MAVLFIILLTVLLLTLVDRFAPNIKGIFTCHELHRLMCNFCATARTKGSRARVDPPNFYTRLMNTKSKKIPSAVVFGTFTCFVVSSWGWVEDRKNVGTLPPVRSHVCATGL